MSLQCPFCKTRLKIPEKLFGKRIDCPKCEAQFVAPAAPSDSETSAPSPQRTRKAKRRPETDDLPKPIRAATGTSTFTPDGEVDEPPTLAGDQQLCPSCEAILNAEAMACIHCGYDFAKKKKKRRRKRKKVNLSFDTVGGAKKSLQPAGWHDIYQTPFDVENVVTESIMLSVWAVVYVFVFLSFLTLLLHPIFWFCLLLAFANYLRIMIVHKDLQLHTLLAFGGLFFGAWFIGGQILRMLAGVETQSFAGLGIYVVTFFFLAYLTVTLIMIAHFFGRYFAICNRSAYGALMSGDDRGGVMDLLFVLVIGFISFTPAVLAAFIAGAAGLFAGSSQTGWVATIALGVPAAMWAYFYFPMASTVAAIEYSVNPLRVFHWITVCFGDYVKLLLLYVPFVVGVSVISLLLGKFLTDVLPAITFVPQALFILFNSFVVGNFFGQYINVVGFTSMGLIARMHESRLGWYGR